MSVLMNQYPVVVDLMNDYVDVIQEPTFDVGDLLMFYCKSTKDWSRCPPIQAIRDHAGSVCLTTEEADKKAGLDLGKLFGCVCRRRKVEKARERKHTYEKALYKKAA